MTAHISPANQQPDLFGISCPECHTGQLSARPSRFGKLFYSCNQYPSCRYGSWKRPIALPCGKCGYQVHYPAKLVNFEFYICGRDGCNEWISSLDVESETSHGKNLENHSVTMENIG